MNEAISVTGLFGASSVLAYFFYFYLNSGSDDDNRYWYWDATVTFIWVDASQSDDRVALGRGHYSQLPNSADIARTLD